MEHSVLLNCGNSKQLCQGVVVGLGELRSWSRRWDVTRTPRLSVFAWVDGSSRLLTVFWIEKDRPRNVSGCDWLDNFPQTRPTTSLTSAARLMREDNVSENWFYVLQQPAAYCMLQNIIIAEQSCMYR